MEEQRGNISGAEVEEDTVPFRSFRLFRFVQGFALLEPQLIHTPTFNVGHQKISMPECAIHFFSRNFYAALCAFQ